MGLGKGHKPAAEFEKTHNAINQHDDDFNTRTIINGSQGIAVDAPVVTYETFASMYRIDEHLGSGAFSQVFRAVDLRTNAAVAVKVISRKDVTGKERLIRREAAILRQCKHPNIVTLNEIIETQTNIYMVMELVTGGELFDYVVGKGSLEPYEAATILHDVLIGLEYLHRAEISHRDLKPENLLFQKTKNGMRTKIADFGLASFIVPPNMMLTACGTPGYVAPEVLCRKGYTRMVDMWSLGVIAYTILCGYPPFYENSNSALFVKIRLGTYDFDEQYWCAVPSLAQDFVRRLIVVDPSKRMSASEALMHGYILKYSQNFAENKERHEREMEEELRELGEDGRKLGEDGELNDSGYVGNSRMLYDPGKGCNRQESDGIETISRDSDVDVDLMSS